MEFFIARALPFGAAASVHGFNRAALALNYLLRENVGAPCTHYFDDYTLIVPKSIGEAAGQLTGDFLK
jgi:ABC-type transporter lipoprotein component MlaA